MSEILLLAIIFTAFITLLVILELAYRIAGFDAEISRKIIHVGI